MNECIITQLLLNIDNNKLRYLGGITIDIYSLTNPSTYAHKLLILPATTMKIIGNGTVTVGNTNYTSSSGEILLNANSNLVFSNDNFSVVFFCKYSTSYFSLLPSSNSSVSRESYVDRGISIDISLFDYTKLRDININGIKLTGTLKNLKYIQYGDFVLTNNTTYTPVSIKLDSADIADNTELVHFAYKYGDANQYNSSNSEIKVNLSHFVNKLSMTALRVAFCNVTGDVVDLANGLVLNGKTSGTIAIEGAFSGMTIDGTYWTQTAIRDKYGLSSTVWEVSVVFSSLYAKGYIVKVGNTTIIQ